MKQMRMRAQFWYLVLALSVVTSLSDARAPLLSMMTGASVVPHQLLSLPIVWYPGRQDSYDVPLMEKMFLLPFKVQRWPGIAHDGEFGSRRETHFHNGLDFMVPVHTRIYAARAGEVVRVEHYNALRDFGRGFGGLVVIRHIDGSQSWYAHLDRVKVHVGQFVTHDTMIGLSGGKNNGHSTGPHLHFMIIRKNGETYNPNLAFWRAATTATISAGN